MKELVIVSGKGGTGKTSIAASFAILAKEPVIADCDVDASDLHLILDPHVLERHEFWSGHEAVIRPEDCNGCGMCNTLCRFDAVRTAVNPEGKTVFRIDPIACEGCGVCVRFCPEKAIDFRERQCGVWMVSSTSGGPMVHARLNVAGENSGKLVSTVRREARRVAHEHKRHLIIVDGPPGIGCPVIASVTGASLVLIVTEPTLSGEHDLERMLSLTRHFAIPTAICVNKWDLNPEMTRAIESKSGKAGARSVGRIRYDQAVTKAQMLGKALAEFDTPAADDIRRVWKNLNIEEGENA